MKKTSAYEEDIRSFDIPEKTIFSISVTSNRD
jgi:hypothetical protein